MDWVEVFAPVVFEPYRPARWPASGSLLVDDLMFRVRDPVSGRNRIAFRIFAAMGYESRAPEAVAPGGVHEQVAARLGGVPGRPGRCPAAGRVRQRRRPHERRSCPLPGRRAVPVRVASAPRAGAADGQAPRRGAPAPAAIDELLADVEAAFTGPSFWAPFVERCHAAGIPRLSEWLNTTGRIVEDQFSRRGPRSARPADMPLSTSPLDGFINPIRDSIQPRAYGLKNRERTNRMLMLMQLHANHQDDERAYVRHIRGVLEANQGRPSIARRAVVDAGGGASLR